MVNMSSKQILSGVIGLITTIALIIGGGYTLGKDHNDSLVNYLHDRNKDLESSEKDLLAQIENLKLELKSTQDKSLPIKGTMSATSDDAVMSGTGTVGKVQNAKSKDENSVTITLSSEDTSQLFDGKLYLTLQAISFEGNPLRHRIFATVGAPGKPNKDIVGADPGFALKYEGYEIRVIQTDTFYAKFLVTHLNAPKT
jgi:hypothetical protein